MNTKERTDTKKCITNIKSTRRKAINEKKGHQEQKNTIQQIKKAVKQRRKLEGRVRKVLKKNAKKTVESNKVLNSVKSCSF